jgi:NADH:ubiquinone oxidoreductase subunit 3 (subunit A)
MGGVGVMGLFVAILGLGWVYAFREGILEWK